MTLETAPGGPDRPELMCVGSSGGLAIHLYEPVEQQVEAILAFDGDRVPLSGFRPATAD